MNDQPNNGQSFDGATAVDQGLVQVAQAETATQPLPVPGTPPVESVAPGTVPAAPANVNQAAQSNAAFAVEKPAAVDLSKAKLTLTPVAGQPLVLPADTQIAAILVSGEDLIIRETDGDLIIIKGGLKTVPSLVLGTVEIPSAALVASLQANGVSLPAAGGADGGGEAAGQGAQSSGGNFARGPGGIGDPFNIRDLLDFSERGRSTEKKELLEGTTKSAIDYQPVIRSAENVNVDEDGLQGRNLDGD